MSAAPVVALLHWGDLIEDFLDTIGVPFEAFRDEMDGGWMFGYVDALATAGVSTVLICVTARVEAVQATRHAPTGAPMWLLPATATYRRMRPWLPKRYAWGLREALAGARGPKAAVAVLVRQLLPYLATPLRPLAQVLRRTGCDAILCQEYEHARFDVSVLLGRLIGVPVHATFQGGDSPETRVERPLRALSMRAAAGIIVGPADEAARAQRRYGVPSARVARIFNPLRVTDWVAADRRTARTQLGIDHDAVVAVWHGRIDLRRKGLDVLVEAWTRLEVGHPERILLLLGTGEDAAELRTLIASRGVRSVRWTDEYVLDRDRIRTYLSAGDVYVFPSRHEGFPVAPVEAMAMGLPVVAAAASGIPDIFPNGHLDGGVVVPTGDATALARALGGALGDPRWRAETGRAARARAESAFSMEAVGRQLASALTPGHPGQEGGAATSAAQDPPGR